MVKGYPSRERFYASGVRFFMIISVRDPGTGSGPAPHPARSVVAKEPVK
jgi:hypothetical protein